MSGTNNSRPFGLKSKLCWLAGAPLLVALDQVSKVWAEEHLSGQPPIIWLNDLIRIGYATNKGAFGSLGAGLSETQRLWLFTIGNAVLLTGLLVYLLVRKDVTRYQFAAFGLILAGGIGNLIDRATKGHVIDFMNVGIGEWPRSNIFNVADLYITCGFLMLVPILLRGAPASHESSARDPDSTGQTTGQTT